MAPARYKVQFTASAEFRDKLDKLAALMPGTELASMMEVTVMEVTVMEVTVMEVTVSEKLERLEAKRLGKTKNARRSLEQADTSLGVRGISASVRRVVWESDCGRCTFVSGDGRRCPERHGLEFHHDEPYGVGGEQNATNIRLLCRVHNLYMA